MTISFAGNINKYCFKYCLTVNEKTNNGNPNSLDKNEIVCKFGKEIWTADSVLDKKINYVK